MKIHSGILASIVFFTFTGLFASEKRAITFEDFFSLKRVKNIRVSPDGQYLACEIRVPDIQANKIKTDIYILDLSSNMLSLFTDSEENSSDPT